MRPMSTETTVRNGVTVRLDAETDVLHAGTNWSVLIIDAAGDVARVHGRDEAHARRIANAYWRAAEPGPTLAEIRAAARAELKAGVR